MILSFHCTVTDIFERKVQKHNHGFGPAAIFSTSSVGWYIQIDGAFSIFVGKDRPDYQVDDAIVLTIKKSGV